MKIDVSSILGRPGFSLTLDMVGEICSSDPEVKLLDPVALKGVATCLGKDVHVEAQAKGAVELICSRCLSAFAHNFEVCCEGIFVDEFIPEKSESEVETFPLEGTFCDLDEMIGHEILLSLPMKPLCSQNCKGLCPTCGENLNEGPCSCPGQEESPTAFGRKLLEALKERSKKDGRT